MPFILFEETFARYRRIIINKHTCVHDAYITYIHRYIYMCVCMWWPQHGQSLWSCRGSTVQLCTTRLISRITLSMRIHRVPFVGVLSCQLREIKSVGFEVRWVRGSVLVSLSMRKYARHSLFSAWHGFSAFTSLSYSIYLWSFGWPYILCTHDRAGLTPH